MDANVCPAPALCFGLNWSTQAPVTPSIESTPLARCKRPDGGPAPRAQIVLRASRGLPDNDFARQPGIGRVRGAHWHERGLASGLQGIERGRPHAAPPVEVDVAKWPGSTTQSPSEAAKHWSTRKWSAGLQLGPGAVRRHWQAADLKPHGVRGRTISRGPEAATKVPDDRVISPCKQRQAHAERLKFLRKIGRETPKEKALHLIADNCATHRHPSAPGRAGRPRQQSKLQHVFHTHLGVMAEPGGAPLPRHHRRAAAPQRVHRRAGVGRRHRRAHRPPPHPTQAVHPGRRRCRPSAEGQPHQQPPEFRTECSTTRACAKDRQAQPNGGMKQAHRGVGPLGGAEPRAASTARPRLAAAGP